MILSNAPSAICPWPTAIELTQDGVAYEPGRGFGHARLDGQPVLRRCLDDAHVTHAHERQVERAWDGRGREREHVDLGLELLQALLVGHAETLLLIDHDEAEILEVDVLAEQTMGADDDVHRARFEPRQRVLLLTLGHETAQRTHGHGIGRETLLERDQVLGREHRRGHQYRHLRARLDGLEGGAQRNLGLAVSDIAHDQAIHGRVPLEIGLDVDR